MSPRFLPLISTFVFFALLVTVGTAAPNRRGGRETADQRRIAAGSNHTCVVRDDGRIQCWGSNAFGQLGDSTTNDRTAPGASVFGLSPGADRPADAVAVAAGAIHTCALRLGNVACWGDNQAGQLGDGTRTQRTSAVQLAAQFPMGLAAGIDHTCVLFATGRVRCWGDNASGQLGTGNNTAQLSAASAVDVTGLSDAVAITAGLFHTCAIRATGRLLCWGANESGQLGNDTTANRNSPDQIANLENVIDVVAGAAHTCALLANGTTRCWGNNAAGALGNGRFDSSLVPVEVSGLSNVKAISAGGFHTCAVRADATTHCWGDNSSGQLGDGTTTNRSLPVAVAALPADAVTVAAGNGHTCVLRGNGTMSCWGFNDAGQLGGAPLGQRSGATAVRFVAGRSPALTLDGASNGSLGVGGHTCAVRATGAVACWGRNDTGEVTGTQGADPIIAPAGPAAATGVASIAAGHGHSCALTVAGTVLCWGSNRFGQIGNGQESDAIVGPTAVPGLDQVVALVAGDASNCALRANGTVHCWGAGSFGRLGNGSTDNQSSPTQVASLGNIVGIAGGRNHYCAIHAAGAVRCWGSGGSGQLGNDATQASNPNHVGVSNLTDARMVSAGDRHTCAIRARGGLVVCWGSNAEGQLGTGDTTSSLVPVPLADSIRQTPQLRIFGITVLAREIGLGANHSCLVSSTIICWGDNSLLQIGMDNLPNSTIHPFPALVGPPADEPVPRGRSIVAPERRRTCALRPDGVPFCWGAVIRQSVSDPPISTPVEIASFRVNIAPQAAFAGQSSTVTLTVTANCREDQHLEVDVQLEQGAASGAGQFSGPCAGGLETYQVTVPARGKPGFVAGPATATATVAIRDNGHVVDTQTWRRVITVVAP